MCTVIVHVPGVPGAPVRLLAVRDEDPARAWDPLGPWWPELPGVRGVRDRRAGGAWLAADPETGRLAVILNRADILPEDGAPPLSRGRIVLDAVAGRAPADPPGTHGFNLVEATAAGASVTMWDGTALRTVALGPGVHMIAHDDVDDAGTARIAAWRGAFTAPEPTADRWAEDWLDTLERTSAVGPTDDRAIVRDNRPFGYPTLSLLVCTASIGADGIDVRYGEFDEPGEWNRPRLA
ncbi:MULTISPECIES: NRDE family protein [unclassified Microbacterium]|uniref:NRDE family protein n=1 Tax=unclassified Microbacterium TaxID=2609290 RepID=UPI00301B3479